ncbi:MAG: OmpH family outer membrane protein [Flavobacteriales bacterium]|nr:OmpH family outer membrane protein [Flavobacteriales bacterium]
MKKIILLFTMFLMSGIGVAIAQKVGHVDFQNLMLQLPERKTAEDSLKKIAGKMEGEMKRMQAKYDVLVTEYERDKKEGKLQGELDMIRQQEIMEYQQRMMKFEEYVQEELSKKEGELLNPMIEKVKASVGKIAKANGINYVLDISQMVYLEGGNDLTPLVKKDLGIQ